jgi:hypothetical protein
MEERTLISSTLTSYDRAAISGKLDTDGIKLYNLVLKNLVYAQCMYKKGNEGYKEKVETLRARLYHIRRYYQGVCNLHPVGKVNSNIRKDDYLNRLVK